MRGLSLVAASGGHSSSRCADLSLSRPLFLRSTGSRRAGSVTVAHGPSCSAACGIFPDQGSNPCSLHWQADSQPLRHQGSPLSNFFKKLKGNQRSGPAPRSHPESGVPAISSLPPGPRGRLLELRGGSPGSAGSDRPDPCPGLALVRGPAPRGLRLGFRLPVAPNTTTSFLSAMRPGAGNAVRRGLRAVRGAESVKGPGVPARNDPARAG